jgi:GTPase SAR1 family protein
MSSVGISMGHRTKLVLRSKVLVVGDACVGKSAVTQLFSTNGSTYPKAYMMVPPFV